MYVCMYVCLSYACHTMKSVLSRQMMITNLLLLFLFPADPLQWVGGGTTQDKGQAVHRSNLSLAGGLELICLASAHQCTLFLSHLVHKYALVASELNS